MTCRSDEIDETKRVVFSRDRWRCVCGKPATQLAHILPQDDLHITRYGVRVVHHPTNLRAVCGLRCNGAVEINRRSRPVEAEAQADRVRAAMREERCAST